LNLGGVMLWSLDQDDYTGLFCRQGPFPLTKRIHDILFSSNVHVYDEHEFSSSTKVTKLRTKNKISFIPIQTVTTQREKLTSTSTQSSSKSKNDSSSVKNTSNLYLLLIILSLLT
jgi:hypothetical protein